MPFSSSGELPIPRVSFRSVVCASLVAGCGRFGYDALRSSNPDAGAPGGARGLGNAGAGSGGAGNGSAGGAGRTDGSGGTASEAGGSGSAGASSGGSAGAVWNGGSADSGMTPDPPLAPTCDDTVQNQDETGIDCGGASCAPCPCTFGAPELMSSPNYPGNEILAVSVTGDALTMYVGGVVQGSSRPIGLTTRSNRGNDFSFASLMPAPVNSSPAVEGTPFVSRDGLVLLFFSQRPGGAGERDLYGAERSNTGAPFDTVVRFVNVNSPQRDHAPWLSPDMLTLYYSSRRASASDDVWRSTRSAQGIDFALPAAVTELNSGGNDTGIQLSDDARVAYFASDRVGGPGGTDLYRAVRANATDAFSTPELVPDLNTGADDASPHFTADRQELFFVSTRNGGDSQLFRVGASCP
jgi:hypothetical protein